MIANAEYHRQIAEKEQKLAEQAHIETQRIRSEAEKERREYESQREAMIRKAKDDARRIMQKAQRESEQIISELKKAKSTQAYKEHELHGMRARLQDGIDELADKIVPVQPAEGEAPTELKVGEHVMLGNLAGARHRAHRAGREGRFHGAGGRDEDEGESENRAPRAGGAEKEGKAEGKGAGECVRRAAAGVHGMRRARHDGGGSAGAGRPVLRWRADEFAENRHHHSRQGHGRAARRNSQPSEAPSRAWPSSGWVAMARERTA